MAWSALRASWSLVVKLSSFEITCLEEVSTFMVNELLFPGLIVTGELWLIENGVSNVCPDIIKSWLPVFETLTLWVGDDSMGISPKSTELVTKL